MRRKLQGRVRLTNNHRWFFIQLFRWFPSILQVLTIIRPKTLDPRMINELRHAAEDDKGVRRVESVRARWLGHRLHAEMTLAVDPTLSLADSRKLADKIRGHARGHLTALETLHVEVVPSSGLERPEHHPEAEHQHQH